MHTYTVTSIDPNGLEYVTEVKCDLFTTGYHTLQVEIAALQKNGHLLLSISHN